MHIKNGIISELLSDEELAKINKHFNSHHPGIEAEISINFNIADKDTPERTPGYYLRSVLKYKHPIEPDVEKWFFIEQDTDDLDVYKIIDSTLDKYYLQLTGCAHEFKRPLDCNQATFNDGRAICSNCELKIKKYLPKIPGQTIIKVSCGDNIVANHFWDDFFVQAGHNGVVLNSTDSSAYTTAFFEAFPKISGLGTFIRGEGKSIHEAEEKCWEKYQKRLACKGHEWDRNVHGDLRDDGYAICVNCGLTATALEPVTKCEKCHKPTTKKFYKKHICYTHYFEIPEEERVKENLKLFSESSWRHQDESKCSFDYIFISRLQHALFIEMTEQEYLELKSSIRHFIGVLKHNFYVLMLDAHPLRNRDFKDEDYALMEECHKLILSKIPLVLKHIKSKGEKSSLLKNDALFHEKYLKKGD